MLVCAFPLKLNIQSHTEWCYSSQKKKHFEPQRVKLATSSGQLTEDSLEALNVFCHVIREYNAIIHIIANKALAALQDIIKASLTAHVRP